MALTQVKTLGIADDAVTLAKQAGGTDGQIITYDASGNPVAVGPGTDGQVLTSTGSGSPPAFEDAAASVGGATGVDFNDNVKVRLGTGNDLEIFHDGSHSNIKDAGSGQLNFWSNVYQFYNAAGSETLIKATEDGAVELYYDNEKRLSTSANSVTIEDSADCTLTLLADNDNNATGNWSYIDFRINNTSGNPEARIAWKEDTSNLVLDCSTGGVDIATHLDPTTNNSFDLGDSSRRWRDLYCYGVYVGGTGDANKLTDYEEGTWTPADNTGTAVSLNNPVGVYTKVGNIVHVQCYFSSNTAGNMAVDDLIKVQGLPFSRDSNVIPPAFIQINYNSTNGSIIAGCTVNTTPAITGRIGVTTGHARSGPGYQVSATYRVA